VAVIQKNVKPVTPSVYVQIADLKNAAVGIIKQVENATLV
jgi:hypothetical protein